MLAIELPKEGGSVNADGVRTYTRENDPWEDPTKDGTKLYDLTDEKLLMLFPNRYPGMEKKLPILRQYLKEIEESEGFDIKHYPGFIWGLTSVIPKDYFDTFLESDEAYIDIAEWAIEEYNDQHGTTYGNVEVEQVNLMVSRYNTYYITFTAEIVDYETDDEASGVETNDGASGVETNDGASGDETDDDGSKNVSAAEGNEDEVGEGGSKDKVGARKVFQALVKRDMVVRDEDPVVCFCRLKANKSSHT